jgi:hypothetical protein
MDDERIERDAQLAVRYLEMTLADLDGENADMVLAINGCRFQAICFLANYFSRQNAPLIAVATALQAQSDR